MTRTKRTAWTLGTLSGLVLLGAGPDSPRSLLLRANQAYRDGLIPRALDLYEQADELSPDDPTILYNWATALASGDDRGLADRLFRKADMLATNDEVRARARFNLAISLFTTAGMLTKVDPQRAIAMFEDSAEAARACVRLQPNDIDAARHVEVARLAAQLVRDQLDLRTRLEELAREQRNQAERTQRKAQQRRNEQPAREQDPNQAQDDQRDSQALENRREQERSTPGTPDFNLPGFLQNLPPQPDPSSDRRDRTETDETPPPRQDESSERRSETGEEQPDASREQERNGRQERHGVSDADAQAQRDLSEQTEEVARTLRRAMEEDIVAGDRDFAEAVLRAIEQARTSQEQAEEQLEQGEIEEAARSQEHAASLLELAERMMNRGQSLVSGQDHERRNNPQQGDSPQQEQPQAGEQDGDPIAEALLDKERIEREMRRAYQRRILKGRVRPKKDW